MGKMTGRETYIWGIYPSILNCGYRNDKIIFDWTKYGSPIEEKIELREKTLFRDRNRYLMNSMVPGEMEEKRKDMTIRS